MSSKPPISLSAKSASFIFPEKPLFPVVVKAKAADDLFLPCSDERFGVRVLCLYYGAIKNDRSNDVLHDGDFDGREGVCCF